MTNNQLCPDAGSFPDPVPDFRHSRENVRVSRRPANTLVAKKTVQLPNALSVAAHQRRAKVTLKQAQNYDHLQIREYFGGKSLPCNSPRP